MKTPNDSYLKDLILMEVDATSGDHTPHMMHLTFFTPVPGEEDEGDEGDRGETWYLCELVNNCSQSQLAA